MSGQVRRRKERSRPSIHPPIHQSIHLAKNKKSSFCKGVCAQLSRLYPTSSLLHGSNPHCGSSLGSGSIEGLRGEIIAQSGRGLRDTSPFRFGAAPGLEEHPQHLEQQTSAEHEGEENCTHKVSVSKTIFFPPSPLQSLSNLGLGWVGLDCVV